MEFVELNCLNCDSELLVLHDDEVMCLVCGKIYPVATNIKKEA